MSGKNRIVNYRMIKTLPVDEYTVALLHFDDENEPYKDECGNIWTANGSPTISATNAKFGKALQLSGTQQLLSDGVFSLGGQDFTIDFWVYGKSSSNNYADLIGLAEDFYNFQKAMGSFFVYAQIRDSFCTYYNQNSVYKPLPSNTLIHCALVYEHAKSIFKVYVNGNFWCSISHNLTRRNNLYCRLGEWNSSQPLYCSIDEFRISDGIARWTENFTPPTEPYVLATEERETLEQVKFYSMPTAKPRLVLNDKNHTKTYAALVEPKIVDVKNSSTIALLHFDDESNPLKDECGNIWKCDKTPIIISENAKFGKSLGNSTIYIEEFAPGGGDATIDFWARRDESKGTFFGIFDPQLYNASAWGLKFRAGYLGWQNSNNGTAEFGSGNVDFSKWNHFAVVNGKVYLNGVFQYDTSNGLFSDGRSYKLTVYGSVDDFRISKTAVWTANFTVPTAPSELAGVEYIDNPMASELRVHAKDDKILAVQKSKKSTTLSLGTNAVAVTANSLAAQVRLSINGKEVDNSREVIVTSNNPEVVTAEYSPYLVCLWIEAKDTAGTAVVSVQVAENDYYEASPIQTITVGNYSFGALNTCTPDEIQACNQLGLAPVTWAVGDDTADIPIAKFTVGGKAKKTYASMYSYKVGYDTVKTNGPYGSTGHAKLIGINHNSGKEGDKRLHFMYWGGTWLEPFIDKKNYGKVLNRATPYSGNASNSTPVSDFDYSITRNGANWELNNGIRKKFIPAFLEAMDAAWRRVLADCPKYTPQHDGEGAEGYTNDKAFILSEYEVFGENPYQHADYLNWNAHRAEANWQAQYDYFKRGIPGAVRVGSIDEYGTATMIPCDWWLRSLPATKDVSGKLAVSGEYGIEIDVNGGKSLGVVPCFVIA